jgi:hypothetical protein
MTTFALISGHSLLHRHRSRIKQSFDVEMEGLDPRVLDSECSESRRLFYTGFETGLQIGQKRLDFSLDFLITTMFSLKSELLKAYPNMTYVPFCLEISVLFIKAPTQHGVASRNMMLRDCLRGSLGCLLPVFCPIFLPF